MSCPLCQEIKKGKQVIRTIKNFIIYLNKFPYKSGHIMILPKEHVGKVNELDPEKQLELIKIISWATNLFEKELDTPSLNIGINHGPDSGASIPQHLHVHIVPRNKNDLGFMSTIAGEPVFREIHIPYMEKVREVFRSANFPKKFDV